MSSAEFVIWLRGFIAASNNYNLTPAGWETLKEQLGKVNVVSPCSGHAFESDEQEMNKRMDIIGQNGNEGLHYESLEELEDEFFGRWGDPPNEQLIEAARRYKEVIEEYDDYGKRIYRKESRPNWYSTSTSDELKK